MIYIGIGMIIGVLSTMVGWWFGTKYNVKVKLFKKALRGAQGQIWFEELDVFSARLKLEEFRQMHDTAINAIESMKADPNITKEQLETAEKQLVVIKSSIDEVDVILNGSIENEKYPNGVVGKVNELANLVTKKKNLEAFIKQHC